ncbi:hypothetical protein JCM1840_000432, partial [Sporobolomyces johnsonii]
MAAAVQVVKRITQRPGVCSQPTTPSPHNPSPSSKTSPLSFRPPQLQSSDPQNSRACPLSVVVASSRTPSGTAKALRQHPTSSLGSDGTERSLSGTASSLSVLLSPTSGLSHSKRSAEDASARDAKGVLREKGMLKAEGKKLMSLVAPMGGMFVWLRVHFASHPLYTLPPTSTLLQQLWEELAEVNVFVAPGTMFSGRTFGTTATEEEGPEVLAITEEGDGCFRIAFGSATEEQMKEATRIIERVVEEFFRRLRGC